MKQRLGQEVAIRRKGNGVGRKKRLIGKKKTWVRKKETTILLTTILYQWFNSSTMCCHFISFRFDFLRSVFNLFPLSFSKFSLLQIPSSSSIQFFFIQLASSVCITYLYKCSNLFLHIRFDSSYIQLHSHLICTSLSITYLVGRLTPFLFCHHKLRSN